MALIAALALAVFALPSALNLPQANPSQTLEYAPVPGNSNAQVGGNLAGLGLGAGDSGASGNGPGAALPALAAPLAGQGIKPTPKDCVGNPPRQTEDPLSPPCVAFFQGDNGGSTYQGVTRNEVRVLFYEVGGQLTIYSGGQDTTPKDTYCDVEISSQCSGELYVAELRVWQSYFNTRYQTYNRFVHFYVYFNLGANPASASQPTGSLLTPDQLRADAAQNYDRIHPFAVISNEFGEDDTPYTDAMAQRHVLVFGTNAERTASFFQAYPGSIWSYWPSVEQSAAAFSAVVCNQVVGRPATFSGNPGENGNPRVLGLLIMNDTAYPEYTAFSADVRQLTEACGAQYKDVLPNDCEGTLQGCTDGQEAASDMATFKRDGVTTLIVASPNNPTMGNAAASIAYTPEWISSDPSRTAEDNDAGQDQNQSEWQHAWTLTPREFIPSYRETPCYQAYTETDPSTTLTPDDIQYWSCQIFYIHVRQLFTGIQVAGPRLTPSSMDTGYHAIPPVRGSDPRVPACFYEANDYSCIKDTQIEYWDPKGRDPASGAAGCWRAAGGAARRLNNQWPAQELQKDEAPNDPCDGARVASY